MCNSVLSKICLLLAIIGGLNWGLVGIWKLDIIAWLLGGQTKLGGPHRVYSGSGGSHLPDPRIVQPQ